MRARLCLHCADSHALAGVTSWFYRHGGAHNTALRAARGSRLTPGPGADQGTEPEWLAGQRKTTMGGVHTREHPHTAYIHIQEYVCMYVCTYVCTYVCMYVPPNQTPKRKMYRWPPAPPAANRGAPSCSSMAAAGASTIGALRPGLSVLSPHWGSAGLWAPPTRALSPMHPQSGIPSDTT